MCPSEVQRQGSKLGRPICFEILSFSLSIFLVNFYFSLQPLLILPEGVVVSVLKIFIGLNNKIIPTHGNFWEHPFPQHYGIFRRKMVVFWKVFLGFRNFVYDYWEVGGDVWRWLCRHVRVDQRLRGGSSLLRHRSKDAPRCKQKFLNLQHNWFLLLRILLG